MKAVFVDNFQTVVAFKITLTNQNVFLAVTTNFSLNFVNHNNQTGCGGPPLIMLLYNLAGLRGSSLRFPPIGRQTCTFR